MKAIAYSVVQDIILALIVVVITLTLSLLCKDKLRAVTEVLSSQQVLAIGPAHYCCFANSSGSVVTESYGIPFVFYNKSANLSQEQDVRLPHGMGNVRAVFLRDIFDSYYSAMPATSDPPVLHIDVVALFINIIVVWCCVRATRWVILRWISLRSSRNKKFVCTKCGYSLAGIQGELCPECGHQKSISMPKTASGSIPNS